MYDVLFCLLLCTEPSVIRLWVAKSKFQPWLMLVKVMRRGSHPLFGMHANLRLANFILTGQSFTGMNLLSKFCIAVSATRKLNCVAVGVICVAVFFWCFGEKNS